MDFLEKLRGDKAALPPQPTLKNVGYAWLGGVLAIGAVALLAQGAHSLLVLGSFGATCVLVFGYPDAPFSQPRNVIFGHLLSSFIGLLFVQIMGANPLSVALAVGTAIAVMMMTRTVHPPAGSNPVIVFLTTPGWNFLLFPTLAGVLIVVLVALFYNNSVRQARYPKYW